MLNGGQPGLYRQHGDISRTIFVEIGGECGKTRARISAVTASGHQFSPCCLISYSSGPSPDGAALAPGPASTEAQIAPQDEHGSDDQE